MHRICLPRSTAIAICSAGAAASAVAIAACTFELVSQEPDADGMVMLQVTPDGVFMPSDGRPMEDAPSWRIDAASAQDVIQRFRATKLPPVIDYEHQTLHKEANGQPAPAAAWIRDLVWKDGRGLYARAELTARARQHIADKEYLYFSPVFEYAKGTGQVLRLLMGALTNNPAIHGMDALSLTAAATAAFVSPTHQENPVNPLLKAVLAALGLPESTTEETALTALSAIGSLTHVARERTQAAAARKALQLGDDATGEAVTAACTSLRGAGNPDPAKYVPIAVVEELRTSVAALTATQQQGELDKAVSEALADGRLLPAMEAWARDLGKTNFAALTGYLKAAQPIAALAGTQTGGKGPNGDNKDGKHGLTEDEIKVASATGLTPEQFAKAKA